MSKGAGTKGRIILIEDQRKWAENFVDILERVDEKRSVVIYQPDEFLGQMISSAQFEDVDICITDLELYGGDDQDAGDLAGLTEILPHVRALAPWIPIACLSRYIQIGNSVLWKLSMSDFDFFSPKKMIFMKKDEEKKPGEDTESHGQQKRLKTNPDFNPERWGQIVQEMQFKRIANLTGRSLCNIRNANGKSLKIESDDTTQNILYDFGISQKSFGNALRLLGIEGSDYYIKTLAPGFSGANVSRVSAHGHEGDEPVNSYWLVKWGRPIWKLEKEAAAHRKLFCRGLDRALQIPQLYSHATMWDGIGYIAYAFEKDAQEALDVVKEKGLDSMSGPSEIIADSLYSEVRVRTIRGVQEISDWASLHVDEAQNLITNSGVSEFKISWSLLHGDLHWRNIFINGKTPTLIDFARSNFGPIAIDAAKIIVDTLARVPPSKLPTSLAIADIKKTKLVSVYKAFESHLTEEHDIVLLDIALRAFAHRYMTYDLEKNQKEMMANLLAVSA